MVLAGLLLVAAGVVWAGRRDPGKGAASQPALRPRGVRVLAVTSSSTVLGGQLTSRAVNSAANARARALDACVAQDPGLKGEVVLLLQVSPKGRVTVTPRMSTIKDPKAETCLRRVAGTIRLHRPGRVRLRLGVRQFAMVVSPVVGVPLRPARPPVVRKSPIVVGRGGPLPRAVIRRIIASHTSEVQRCYEQPLVKQPALAERVVVKFTITGEGKVSAAHVSASTLRNPAVGKCLVRRIMKWVFPRPLGGGIVKVSYPFVFSQPGSH